MRRLHYLGFAAAALFLLMAARFWHPYYGFTRFLQIDEAGGRRAISEMRSLPHFTYGAGNDYDGAAYAQIAFHPLLDSPELGAAIDSFPYRARRILGSALAWALAGGNPGRIADTYAALNIGVWLAFAWVLWRLLPVSDGRSWAAWAGLMFSAGALFSVRLALTDLLAVTVLAAALALAERRRPAAALGLVGISGLARETAVAGVVALWRGPWDSWRAWMKNAALLAAAAAPLLAWMAYVRWRAGPAALDLSSFSWPLSGFIGKWMETARNYPAQPGFAWLNTTTLLATVGLTAQAVYIVRRPQPASAWWRVGAAEVALMALLGSKAWEGQPGAVTRVLLPMGLAFSVLAVRQRASWAWLILGNLSVLSGILAMSHVPQGPAEISSGRSHGIAYSVRAGRGWYTYESTRSLTWSWAPGPAEITVLIRPAADAPLHIRIQVRAATPRDVDIRQGDDLLWHGPVGTELQWIDFQTMGAPAPLTLRIGSGAPPARVPGDPRPLSLAVYDAKIE
jgi:hypothetical protein